MLRNLVRLVRTALTLASRPATVLLLWTHRRTVAMWLRSVDAEWRHGREAGAQDPTRWRRLVAELGRATVHADPASPIASRLVLGEQPDVVTAVP